ncbi:DEAD/DEAH box helicase domain-containing protein [Besnoitia besnoiti]|uniref:ATP-dependent RNA helicase n=1 Tax=Besnoitia besnoiti TaxID=94643 RepID=A0A2A9M943_BESBE|nr:DEAD/DEAH box helicase domain-containing protein [Besnoitia besnoiti]PFH34515.1 DEAD/DEAH box helicase domain-containing protein [Besnoitia besnoiti]
MGTGRLRMIAPLRRRPRARWSLSTRAGVRGRAEAWWSWARPSLPTSSPASASAPSSCSSPLQPVSASQSSTCLSPLPGGLPSPVSFAVPPYSPPSSGLNCLLAVAPWAATVRPSSLSAASRSFSSAWASPCPPGEVSFPSAATSCAAAALPTPGSAAAGGLLAPSRRLSLALVSLRKPHHAGLRRLSSAARRGEGAASPFAPEDEARAPRQSCFTVLPRPPDPDMPQAPKRAGVTPLARGADADADGRASVPSASASSPVSVLRSPTQADLSGAGKCPTAAFKPAASRDSFPLPPAGWSQTPRPSSGAGALESAYPNFAALDVHPVLVERLRQLQIHAPTATQISAFLLIDKGRDCVIVDRTGTGKTLAFLLPFLNKIYKLHDILLLAQLEPSPAPGAAIHCGVGAGDQPTSATAGDASGDSPSPLGARPPEHAASSSPPSAKKSVGRMLQEQLMRRQEEALARHAALSPTPTVWEKRAELSSDDDSAASALEDALSAAGLQADVLNPLGALRPAVLLLPTHDMVADALHMLRRLDVLGRLQIQCLSGVERNVRERLGAEAEAAEAQAVRELRRHFGGAGAQAPPAAASRGKALDVDDAQPAERLEAAAERERDLGRAGESRGWEGARRRRAEEAMESRDAKRDAADEDMRVWHGQVLRRPRLTADGALLTETRPFTEKRVKNIHEIRLRGSERAGLQEVWRSEALQVDGAQTQQDEGEEPLRASVRLVESREQTGASALETGKDLEDNNPAFQVCSLPVLHKPRIRWGAVDLVITTPHLFLEDLERFRGENLQPSLLILDEVDDLLHARGSRTLLMDILGYCRPRVPVPVPHTAKPPLPEFEPCQVVFSGATLASLGPCSPGVMLIERFGSASEVSPLARHQLRDEVKQLWIRLNAERLEELQALARPPWRSARAEEEEEEDDAAGDGEAEGRSLATVLGEKRHMQHELASAPDAGGRPAGEGGRRRRVKGGLITGTELAEQTKTDFILLGGNLPVFLRRRHQKQRAEAQALETSTLVAESGANTNSKRKLRMQVSWDHRVDILLGLLAAFPVDRTVVFVNSVDRCIRLFDFFRDRGWPVVSFHRKMSMKHRTRALARLMLPPPDAAEEADDEGEDDEARGGRCAQELSPASLMIATDLACRGLDLQGVQHVINFDFPSDALAYIHRAGRTCRRPSRSRSVSADDNPFCLVSNLISDDDFPLASSLYFLQQEKQSLEKTFSRKASFKARYNRHREAEKRRKKEAEREEALAVEGAREESDSDDGQSSAGCADVDQLWKQMYRLSLRGNASRARGEAGKHTSARLTSRSAGRGEAAGEGSASGEASGARSRDRGRRLGRLKTLDEGGDEAELSARVEALQRNYRLVSRLLGGAVWSEDGKVACIEAPRSFFDLEDENADEAGRKGTRFSASHGREPDRFLGSRLATRGRRTGPVGGSLHTDASDGEAAGEGAEAPHGVRGGRWQAESQASPVPEEIDPPARSDGRSTGSCGRALQMRAKLFADDSDEEEASAGLRGEGLGAGAGAAERSLQRGVPRHAPPPTGRTEPWTEEDYDRFVVRRFQPVQGTRGRAGRGVDSRLAPMAHLQRKAAEMRTKMLMNNFGASDESFDEDLKV